MRVLERLKGLHCSVKRGRQRFESALVTHQFIKRADAIMKKNIFQKRQVVIPGRSH
jgi:hypothetical protein